MDLATLRRAIDRVDDAVARLLGLRARLVAQAWALKRRGGVPVRDPDREQAILARVARRAPPLPAASVRAVFTAILAACSAAVDSPEDP